MNCFNYCVKALYEKLMLYLWHDTNCVQIRYNKTDCVKYGLSVKVFVIGVDLGF